MYVTIVPPKEDEGVIPPPVVAEGQEEGFVLHAVQEVLSEGPVSGGEGGQAGEAARGEDQQGRDGTGRGRNAGRRRRRRQF